MTASGLQIYMAYARFGRQGGSLLPNPLQDRTLPEWSRLGGWLAGALSWHFTLMWPLMAVGALYLGYLVVSGEWRKLLFRPSDIAPSIAMAKYYLRRTRTHPPQGKHNALQKQAYSGIIALGVLSVLTGIAIWKPVQLHWLTALFGGFQAARYWHFWVVWLFVGFTVVHVFMVLVVEPATLRAMITGTYYGTHGREDSP
jgi:thiosulfate reductase cytochrome b subunit